MPTGHCPFGSSVVTCTSRCHTANPKDQTLLRHLGKCSPCDHPAYFSPPPGTFPAASLGSVQKILEHPMLVLTLVSHQSLLHPLQPSGAPISPKYDVVFHLLILYLLPRGAFFPATPQSLLFF